MKRRFSATITIVAVFGCSAWAEEFAQKSTWQSPAAGDVRTQVVAWLDGRNVQGELRQQIDALWPADEADTAPGALLQRLVETLAKVDDSARQLVEFCSQPRPTAVLSKFEILANEQAPPLVRNNLRLIYGRWLAQERLYDEALKQLDGLTPGDVVDPASLLFFQGVANHWMLQKDAGLKAINQLLERRESIPRRYSETAQLMHADLSALEDESLDHIARRMNDITRRLEFGHAGKKVRAVEDGVIESLDKLIEELEKQQQAAAAAMAGSATPSGKPAQDSAPLTGKGPGEVTTKKIGTKSGWGDLPPKQREEALQQIGKEFPSHYREVIEQYFRQLAAEEGGE